MLHPIKVTSTLADETRFSIYEYMLQQKKYFSVQEISDQFSIHANVARLHLTKLTEIGAISAEYLKTGKGGRPGRVYRVKQEGIQLSFPRRDPSSLLKWCIQLISELGEEAVQKGMAISYEDGKQSIHELVQQSRLKSPISFDEKISLLTKSAKLIGYVPEVHTEGETKSIIFSIFNCPFHEQMTANSEVICQLHESYLRGQVDFLFEENDFVQIESMQHECGFCNYKISTQS